MAKSSIHIEAGGGGYFAHNSRETPTVNSVFSDEQNFCSCSKEDAFKLYRSELQIRSEAYTERTGQKLQKNAITHLSAIVNFNKDHTPEDMQRVCELLERKLDTKVLQMAMHRDEGKSADDKNYHAHIEFMGLDSRGESVRRKLDRPTLRELQSEVSKTLGMERGHDYAKERLPRPKRLDTYEYKAHKEGIEKEVKKVVLATQKDLNAEIALLRSQLKEQGATRSEYAQLEQINRELKEQIKAKDLTVDQLTKSLETVRTINHYSEGEKAELRSQIILKDQMIDHLKEAPPEPINASLIVQLQDENKILKISNKALETEVSALKQNRAAVEVAQGDTAQLKELKDLSEEWEQEILNPNFSKKETFEDLEAFVKKDRDPKKVAIAVYNSHIVPDTGIMGKLGGEKKDTDLLIANMAKEIGRLQNMLKSSVEMLKNAEVTRTRLSDSLKTVVKSTKTAVEAFFSKKERDLSSEVKKERTEPNLSNTDKIRGFIDQLKGNDPTKSRGLER